jgi:hypothetical protein
MSAKRWRYFAAKLEVERQQRWPMIRPQRPGSVCHRHGEVVGFFTGICAHCHEEAWAWTGERYQRWLKSLETAKAAELDKQFQTALELDDARKERGV